MSLHIENATLKFKDQDGNSTIVEYKFIKKNEISLF